MVSCFNCPPLVKPKIDTVCDAWADNGEVATTSVGVPAVTSYTLGLWIRFLQ